MLNVFVTLPPARMSVHACTEFSRVSACRKNSDFQGCIFDYHPLFPKLNVGISGF